MEDKWYEYWFACIEGINSERKREIRTGIGSLEKLYNIEETGNKYVDEKEKKKILESIRIKNWKEEYEKVTEEGIRFVTCIDSQYPQTLNQLKGMPYALFYKGTLFWEEECKTVAIVGARRCSTYGEKMSLKFAEELAACGVVIVSGMARGVDGIAHRGALNSGGRTCAVLGSGVDICYPAEHKGLYMDIIENGCILSEVPPGTKPLPRNFPARNRIISGLSQVVLVMEAKEQSGSLITADMALEQGKDIYALPGNIESELSRGCNKLIYQGAGILLSPKELIEELGISGIWEVGKSSKKGKENKIMLETSEKLVYSCLGFYPKNKEEILKETKLMPQDLSRILVVLELKGYIEERSKNYYIRRR